MRKIVDRKTFRHDVLLAFWLAVHLEKVELASMIYGADPIIDKILTNFRRTVGGEEKRRKADGGAGSNVGQPFQEDYRL